MEDRSEQDVSLTLKADVEELLRRAENDYEYNKSRGVDYSVDQTFDKGILYGTQVTHMFLISTLKAMLDPDREAWPDGRHP